MRIITLRQPWANFIAFELKNYETRSWSTTYRGLLLIHAAKRRYAQFSPEEQAAIKIYRLAGWKDSDARALKFLDCNELPLGKVVAIANLVDCIKMTKDFINAQTQIEITTGDWRLGRFAWKLEKVRAIEAIPWKGAQGLRSVANELKVLVEEQLRD